MNAMNWTDGLGFLLPEFVLFFGALLVMLIGLYGGDKRHHVGAVLTLIILGVSAFLLWRLPAVEGREVLLNGMLVVDSFIFAAKGIILLAAFMACVLSHDWMRRLGGQIFDYYLLLLLSTVGLLLMVSAATLLSVYLAVELASLSLYILASFRRDSLRSTEAGLKYFVLGSLASGMMLFGMSFIYGFTGSIEFIGIHAVLLSQATPAAGMVDPSMLGALVGMVLLMIGLCFKVSAVPFHMWTPDVYEGAPTPVTAFFATAPKVAALVLFARILFEAFADWHSQWQQVIIVVSIASMIVGALGAMVQKNIKRMLAYSSIGHVGYALMALATGTEAGMQGLLIYLTLYVFMSIGAFGCVLLMQNENPESEDITALSGLSHRHPFLAIFLAIFMFSLAGIPPLAGFFGKFYVFMAALEAGLVTLAVIGVLSSVIAAFYYLRLVKLMYFDEEKDTVRIELSQPMKYALAACVAVTLLFFLFPAPLVEIAKEAASALSLWS